MKVFARIALFVLFMFVLALPVLAQEAEAPPAAEAPDPAAAFAGMLLLATSVFFVVEQVKPAINAQAEQRGWSDHIHQFVIRGVAALVALFLIFSIPNAANIIVAFGLTWQLPDVLAKVITALAVSGGSAFIYALQTFFKPSLAVEIPITEVREVKGGDMPDYLRNAPRPASTDPRRL
jgi:hypothetical protein